MSVRRDAHGGSGDSSLRVQWHRERQRGCIRAQLFKLQRDQWAAQTHNLPICVSESWVGAQTYIHVEFEQAPRRETNDMYSQTHSKVPLILSDCLLVVATT